MNKIDPGLKDNQTFSREGPSKITSKKILVGRPRLLVDFATILRMRDEDKMGWSRMAEAYRKITGQYISRDTIKRRYLEANV
jgi:hypothetical protein